MLFFFTLGSSMVGDICDEAELNTGYRSDGSYFAVFGWFIKMGTSLSSFISGALIVLTLFDETQVTKVDKLQGSVRDMRASVESWRARGHDSADEEKASEKLELAKANASELASYFEAQAKTVEENRAHYQELARTTQALGNKLSQIRPSEPLGTLDTALAEVEAEVAPLTRQGPHTLLMMRVMEIGLPLIGSLFSMLCILRYTLTETRTREIKALLAQRHALHGSEQEPAGV